MINDRFEIKISRSNKNIFAQAFNDGKTIVGHLYRFEKGITPVQQANNFGKHFGHLLINRNIKKIRYNRKEYLYHGKIKSFADGLREVGIVF